MKILSPRLFPLVFAALAGCGSLDVIGKDGCALADDCRQGFACQAGICVEGSPANSDSDGDGVRDLDETNGWEIVVDERGYGLAADAQFLVRRTVKTDPRLTDTDGDGISDGDEFNDRSDPSRVDTDGDGLDDFAEKFQHRSNVLSVDTDGDARDATSTTLPLADMFDGAELRAGTSPSLADTDGDGKSDLEERDAALRDPRVAEIPQAEISTVGDLTVQLNVEYADAMGESTTYGQEFSTTESSRTSRSDMESTAVTIAGSAGGEGFFDDLEFSVDGAIKFFGGKLLEVGRGAACQATTDGEVAFDAENPNVLEAIIGSIGDLAGEIFSPIVGGIGGCEPPTPETTNTTSTTLTRESSRSATESYSEYRTTSRTRTETAASGVVSLGFKIKNVGLNTIEVVNPAVTMFQWHASPRSGAALGAGAFRTLTTLRPTADETFTLAPDEEVVVQMANENVNTDFIKDFLARPQAVFFSPARFALNDVDGIDYDFLTEETFGRTATLVIDDGVANPIRYQVATNVERTADGGFAGVRMGTVLRDIVNLPFTTTLVERRNAAGDTVMVEELESIGNLANQRSANRGDPENGIAGDSQGLWVVYVRREEQAAAELPFEDVRMFAGDEVRIVYIRDIDGDGVFTREENIYGSDDNDNDSDRDGLSDFQELKVGWDVTIDYTDRGTAKSVTYRVSSDPTSDDADQDGVNDVDEKAQGTDPNNPDTDDDGLSDKCDTEPKNTDVTGDNGTCNVTALFMYLSTPAGVQEVAIGRDGALSKLRPNVIPTENNDASDIVLTPDGRHLFLAGAGNGSVAVHAYDVDTTTGEVTLNPFEALELGSGIRDRKTIAMNPNGRFVYTADAGDNDRVYTLEINDTDQPGRVTSVASENSYSSQVTKLVADPMGRFVYGVGANAEIYIYTVDMTTGVLMPFATDFRTAARPRGLDISPDGEHLYVANSDMTMDVYAIDPITGGLDAIDGSPFPTVATFNARYDVDPFGRFIYVANGDRVYLHTITPVTGTIPQVDHDGDPANGLSGLPVTTRDITDLEVDPSGRYLFVTDGRQTHTLTIGVDGRLTEELPPVDAGGSHLAIYGRVL